jgi:hypothetical protein
VEELLLSALNVCRVNNIRQIEICTPEPSPFEAETAIANFKKYKSSGSDHILAELGLVGGEILCSGIQ